MLSRVYSFLQSPVHIAPLVTFRIVIGALMLFSSARYIALGWVDEHYLKPVFHFHYFFFEWVEVLPPFWMYALHGLMLLSALCVLTGFYFRIASVLLFLSFTYTELIDLTYYLNHYYFVSLVLFLLAFTPANRNFSIDVFQNPSLAISQIPRIWIYIFQFLLAIVYTYAGLTKINYDWLVNALPLKIWLPAHDNLPLIGDIFTWSVTPYLFSWFGMVYDCTIIFWLWNSRTRNLAYLTVITFHLLTGLLFQIGVFPLVMIGATLIFFSERWHINLLNCIGFSTFTKVLNLHSHSNTRLRPVSKLTLAIFTAFFCFQILFPWRYLCYPGNLFWTEEGYRFSWRVMLMEKAGTATFYVKDEITKREGIVVNSEFLNSHQEKQMAMQPDMILQYAHFLYNHYQAKGVNNPQVRAEIYVTLNARPSELLIDPTVNLATLADGWERKLWIRQAPYD